MGLPRVEPGQNLPAIFTPCRQFRLPPDSFRASPSVSHGKCKAPWGSALGSRPSTGCRGARSTSRSSRRGLSPLPVPWSSLSDQVNQQLPVERRSQRINTPWSVARFVDNVERSVHYSFRDQVADKLGVGLETERSRLEKQNWQPHSNMMALGILPTGENETSMYYHDRGGPTSHLRRLVLRTDGFVSLRAPYCGGEFTTKPVIFGGSRLVLNVATGAAGSVKVEIQDADGEPLKDRHLKDCVEFYGDTIAHTVSWRAGSDLAALVGKPVRLRFVMRDCDLYSLQFRK